MKMTAGFLLALMILAGPAMALTVSKKVGPLLQEAQAMIARQDYKAAMAKVDEAEAAKATADDETVISQIRQFITVKTSSPSQP